MKYTNMQSKAFFFSIFFIIQASQGISQGKGFDSTYRLLSSRSIIADKNFYLFTLIEQNQGIIKEFTQNDVLNQIYQEKRELLQRHAVDTLISVANLFSGFFWSVQDSIKIDKAIKGIYNKNPGGLEDLVNGHLRPSGCYQRFQKYSNLEFLLRCVGQYIQGENYIISQYGLGKKLRYPAIDSASYNVNSEYYRSIVKPMFSFLNEKANTMSLFYQPSLAVALQLMDVNDRGEPAQFEPLEKGENKAAYPAAATTEWGKYPFSAILVPGEGPEILTVPLSPGGKMRCELAADRFLKKMAPFIIVSGGNCHPFHTPYNEAFEMKKYLMAKFSIPENAIIIEPQARHTTTNFRNGNRLIIRYGFPVSKPALCVTTVDQANYIDNPRFDKRNMVELGYLPYKEKKRLSVHEFSYYPVMESLHMDPTDPLDP